MISRRDLAYAHIPAAAGAMDGSPATRVFRPVRIIRNGPVVPPDPGSYRLRENSGSGSVGHGAGDAFVGVGVGVGEWLGEPD